jgi:hypothetical protein
VQVVELFRFENSHEEKTAPGKIRVLKELSGHKTRQKTYCSRVGKPYYSQQTSLRHFVGSRQ